MTSLDSHDRILKSILHRPRLNQGVWNVNVYTWLLYLILAYTIYRNLDKLNTKSIGLFYILGLIVRSSKRSWMQVLYVGLIKRLWRVSSEAASKRDIFAPYS